MSTDHESHTLHVENEYEVKHAIRLHQVNFITNAVAVGLAAGIVTGLVLDRVLGTTVATGTGTILGSLLGGLLGVILLRINKRSSEAESLVFVHGSDAEPPESV